MRKFNYSLQRFKLGPWGLVESITETPPTAKARTEQRPLVPAGAAFKRVKNSSTGRSISSFASLEISTDSIFEFGNFVADVTSSSRLELPQQIGTSSETNRLVELQFGTSNSKQRGRFIKSVSSESQIIISIRESVSAQLLIDKSHIGRLTPSIALTLGPLIFCDLIRVSGDDIIQRYFY